MIHILEINIPSIAAVIVAALKVARSNRLAIARHARQVNKVVEWALSQPEITGKSDG